MNTSTNPLDRLYALSKDHVRPLGLCTETAELFYQDYIEFVLAHAPGGRLLDIGCGNGWSTYLFAVRGYEATGIDLNQSAFEPPAHERLRLCEGSGTDLPFSDASFDLVCAYQTIEHVTRPERMLSEMVRVVRPGGIICIVGPNLLSLANSVRALFCYVWKNRPAMTIFVRRPGMPRHPFGNTVPEALFKLCVNLLRVARKALWSRAEFTLRHPDLQPPFHGDNDAVYLCNPLDITQFFGQNSCRVRRDAALGRSSMTRMIAGGTWVAAQRELSDRVASVRVDAPAGNNRQPFIARFLIKLFRYVPSSWLRIWFNARGRFPRVKRATDWLPNLLRNRVGRIQKGLGRGLWFNGGNSAVGFLLGSHDTDVQYALAHLLRPGQVCYDIGANVGFTALLAAKCVGDAGQVVCFEPLPENTHQIRVNADLNGYNQIKVHDIALGSADGNSEFQLSQAPTWGRLKGAGRTPEQRGVVQIPVRQLDSVVAEQRLPQPQVIKIDVEGAEAAVLAGARSVLERCRPVLVIELHHTYQAVLDALAGLDYVIRPLVSGGQIASTEGEFQLLAYPAGHPEAEALWATVEGGEKMIV